MDTHRRVMDAQLQIAESLLARGAVSEEQVDEALGASQKAAGSETAAEEAIYLSALARYVAALGGHLELRAVFPDGAVTLPAPGAPDGARPAGDHSSGSGAS